MKNDNFVRIIKYNDFLKVAHFYEDLLEDYSGEIREMAGYLNILAKIARSDNTRSMGLYFFDQHLL